MKITPIRERLLASSMICGAALLGLSAMPAAAQQAGAEVSEVVVTGSRIPQPNLTSVSAVTALTSQEIKLQGTTNVENLLNNLPQVIADQSSGAANGASGTATVNLRGLGAQRTLVLVDGRRVQPGDPILPVADLNSIPAALIQRVDVLTGGASAVYGSDAIAGVVNFIMQRDFEGVRFDAQYLGYQHNNHNSEAERILGEAIANQSPLPIAQPKDNTWDGDTVDITAIFGVNSPDGKGNVTAYVGYRNLQAVLQSSRDFSSCVAAATTSGANIYDAHICAGSSNSAFGRFSTPNTGGLRALNPDGSRSFVPRSSTPAFNFAPTNYFQRPDERYTAGFFARYELNKYANLYSDFMFADDHTVAQIAPSGLFAGSGPSGRSTFEFRCDNPLASFAQLTALCGAGNEGNSNIIVPLQVGLRFEGLPRQNDLRHTSYLFTVGSRGDLAEGWTYDAHLQYGTSIFSERFINDVSLSRVQQALNVDPITGECDIGPSTGCVPLDIFRFGGLTPEALAFVVAPGFQNGQTTQQIAQVNVTGELGQYGVKSPWATDGVGVAVGAEYRREGLEFNNDLEFSSGDLSGQGGPSRDVSGSFDVYELYGEARVPLAQDLPFAKDFSTELGYRFSDYSTATGTTHAYKVGLNWSINDDIKLRGGYNRAVRAPNVVELFTPQAVGLFGGTDPCASSAPPIAACLASGATLAQLAGGTIGNCPAAQCSALFGGNPELEAEESDAYTAGLVLQPRWLPGFDLTVDWFNIKVKNLISSLPNLTLTDCFANLTPSSCAAFQRDPATGEIFGATGFINAVNTNTGFLKTEGVDVAANYRANLSDWGLGEWGGLAFNLIGTWTDKYEIEFRDGAPIIDCAGLFGLVCSSIGHGGPVPEWRHKLRVTWTTPWPATVSVDWRYISKANADINRPDSLLSSGANFDAIDDEIPAISYFDLSGTWKVRDNFTFRGGVRNIFDRDPKIIDSAAFGLSSPPNGNGNTFVGTYDVLGRTVFVGFTADF